MLMDHHKNVLSEWCELCFCSLLSLALSVQETDAICRKELLNNLDNCGLSNFSGYDKEYLWQGANMIPRKQNKAILHVILPCKKLG